jgi:hypothetical protein
MPLSQADLDTVRKALGQDKIAAVQATAIDAYAGSVSLSVMLVQASGQ